MTLCNAHRVKIMRKLLAFLWISSAKIVQFIELFFLLDGSESDDESEKRPSCNTFDWFENPKRSPIKSKTWYATLYCIIKKVMKFINEKSALISLPFKCLRWLIIIFELQIWRAIVISTNFHIKCLSSSLSTQLSSFYSILFVAFSSVWLRFQFH